MSFDIELKAYWNQFHKDLFCKNELDLFVSGITLYSPFWLKKKNKLKKFVFIGSFDDLKLCLFSKSWQTSISVNNRLLYQTSLKGFYLEFELFESLDDLFSFLESSALNYEKVCYSFRQSRFVENNFIEKAHQVICDRPLSFSSKKDFFYLCLVQKLRIQLLIDSKFLGDIDFVELCQLGLFNWIENQNYVSFLLDDLYHMNVLSPESKNFILSLMSILNWLEKNYSNILIFFENSMLSHKSLFKSRLIKDNYKKYLVYSSQSKFIDAFNDNELVLLNDISKYKDSWIEYFEGNPISLDFLAFWVDSFLENYLEAYVLSAMHFLRVYGDSKNYRFKINKILQEFLLEEAFVKNMLKKASLKVDEKSFLRLLSKRFLGELKSIHSLRVILGIKKRPDKI
ncbi:MAG: hypothetical protein COB02_11210 [Candidatus Cloacimonadota bacterium]|nr:MAG: hypothetical protein COB02_11210 [Candidatus Cloacimonadota bacterium]